jgi:hypothetical protein
MPLAILVARSTLSPGRRANPGKEPATTGPGGLPSIVPTVFAGSFVQ